MHSPWVWKSSGALVTGVLALFAGALLMPATGGNTAEALRLVDEQDGRWLAVGVMFLGAGVALRAGTVARWIPAMLVAHAATWPLTPLLPDAISGFTVALTVLGFCRLAFAAVTEQERTLVLRGA